MRFEIVACCAVLALLVATSGSEGQTTTPGSRRSNADWVKCDARLTKEIRKADSKSQGYGVIFYGDSLMETWRGTDHCGSCDAIKGRATCRGSAAVFNRHFKRHRPAIMGIGGDQVANLIWRLQNGQMPQQNKPKVAVLMIGINDLGVAGKRRRRASEAARALRKAWPGVADRIEQAVAAMRGAMPSTQIILMGLLPRGTGSGEGRMPMSRNDFSWPSVYTSAIESVNARLRALPGRDSRLHYLDCGGRMLRSKGRGIDPARMPDALHHAGAGSEALAKCISPLVDKLMAAS